jgi:hypothetical protein
VPSDGPEATAGQTTTGGSGAASACALMSADEAGGVFGVSGVATELLDGEPSYCFYRDASGNDLGATAYIQTAAKTTFDFWKTGMTLTSIPGVGDDAVYEPDSETLFVLKGDVLLSVTAGTGATEHDQRIDWATQIGRILVSHL